MGSEAYNKRGHQVDALLLTDNPSGCEKNARRRLSYLLIAAYFSATAFQLTTLHQVVTYSGRRFWYLR